MAGTFTIPRRIPKISVVVYHGKTKYDLSGDVMQCKTHKDVGEAAGQWSLLLTFKNRWDQKIKPMDYIEIRMQHMGSKMKIIMRGFVNNARRTRVMEESGQWQRTVTINGWDYGCLFTNYQVYYMAQIPGQVLQGTDVDPAQGLLAPLLSENLGIFKNAVDGQVPLKQFMPELVQHTIDPYVSTLQHSTPNVSNIVTYVHVEDDYVVNWLTLQSEQGGLDQVMGQFANAPWCEWFVTEMDDYPMIVHRNTPYRDSSGKYVFSSSVLDQTYFPNYTIYDAWIEQEDIGVSGDSVYDYYFTYPELFTGGDLIYKQDVISSGEFGIGNSSQAKYNKESDLNYPSNPKIDKAKVYKYGLQIMECASPAIPIVSTGDGSDPTSMTTSIKMNMWLVKSFEWAPDMLNGTIIMQGDENIRIGTYLFNHSVSEVYYVESVDQTWTFSQPNDLGDEMILNMTTTLGVTRGYSAKSIIDTAEPASETSARATQTVMSSSQRYNAYHKGLGLH